MNMKWFTFRKKQKAGLGIAPDIFIFLSHPQPSQIPPEAKSDLGLNSVMHRNPLTPFFIGLSHCVIIL